MQEDFERLDFAAIRRKLTPFSELSQKGALSLANAAERMQHAAIRATEAANRATEYASFLEGLIHDLREERGLPQMPTEMEWDNFKRTLTSNLRYAFRRYQIDSFEELCALTEKKILFWHGVGPVSLKRLKDALTARGLSLRGSFATRQGRVVK